MSGCHGRNLVHHKAILEHKYIIVELKMAEFFKYLKNGNCLNSWESFNTEKLFPSSKSGGKWSEKNRVNIGDWKEKDNRNFKIILTAF